jgi:hypothetical protein
MKYTPALSGGKVGIVGVAAWSIVQLRESV